MNVLYIHIDKYIYNRHVYMNIIYILMSEMIARRRSLHWTIYNAQDIDMATTILVRGRNGGKQQISTELLEVKS